MNTAAFIHGVKDIRIEPFDPPTGTDDTVNIDVASVGICGSDLHYYKDGGIGSATINTPFVPGHEFSGRLKTDIESLALTRGQLVSVDPALPCHSCEWCHRGHHNLCPNVIFIGAPPFNGALTQTINVPRESIVTIPQTMTADEAAMLEPLGVCIHAIDLAKPKLYESVAVLGCGPIGLGILQLLKISTCGPVYAVDPLPHRTKAALQHGADAIGDNTDAILDATNGLGCDLVIEATNSPNAFVDSVKAAKIGARVVLVGIPDGNDYAPVSAAEARRRGLSIKFSRRMGTVYPRAIELVSSKKVDVESLVSHHFPLDGTPDAFAMQDAEDNSLIKSIILLDQ